MLRSPFHMDKIDQIIGRYIESKEERSAENTKFLEDNIIGRTSDEIAHLIANFVPDEKGGLIAISGFYYQFLVTIEYMIDMLEGKWDYIFIEHLDDIVVGKENVVRFVQVKTSEKVKVDVTASPANGLYNRSIITGGQTRRNNSWIDKLLSKAELLKSDDGYITQFQLYSSYHFIKTNNYNFDVYTGNDSYNIDIPDEDDLHSKLTEPAYDKEGVSYDYLVRCGETLKDLLKRFYLFTGSGLHELEVFKNHLCIRLSKWMFRDIGDGVCIKLEDINTIIGHLCTKCTYRDSSERLLITSEKLEGILAEIREKCLASVDQIAEKHGTMTVTSKIIDSLVAEIETCVNAATLKDKLYTYREYLKHWIDDGGNIRSLIDKYVEGTIRSSAYSRLSDTNREKKLHEFFSMVFILMIVRDSILEFTDTTSLLTKKCTVSNLLFSFLSLELRNNLDTGLRKLETIIQHLDINNHLYLLDKTMRIVFQNYTDRRFINTTRYEIKGSSKVQLEGLEDEHPLNKVTLQIDVIPGNELTEDFYEVIDEGDSFQYKMQEIWNKYCCEVY